MASAKGLRGVALAAFCATAIPALSPAGAQQKGDLEALRARAVALVNASRAEQGLAKLQPGPVLNETAQDHAEDMVARDYYAHVGPGGQTPHDRFLASGGSPWAVTGENIARCSGCESPADTARVEAFHDGWMQSPEHRANILSEGFTQMGFGIAGEGGEVYAVQTFAGPGHSGGGAGLAPQGAREAALQAVNARRQSQGLAPLKASAPLDTVAGRFLDARLAGEIPPQNIFALLPEGATGWTSIAIRSGSRGGSGGTLSASDVSAFVDQWASADDREVLGGERAGYFGFAANAREDGRTTAVAVLGGRD